MEERPVYHDPTVEAGVKAAMEAAAEAGVKAAMKAAVDARVKAAVEAAGHPPMPMAETLGLGGLGRGHHGGTRDGQTGKGKLEFVH